MVHPPINAETGRARSFAITYRNGRTDVVWTIGGTCQIYQGQDMKLVFAPSFEEGLIEATRATQTRLQQFGVEGAWVVQVSIHGVRDHPEADVNVAASALTGKLPEALSTCGC